MTTREVTRDEVKRTLAVLPQVTLDRIAMVIETADVQGDWEFNEFNGEDSVYTDDVQGTLDHLANEFHTLKTRRLT